MTNTLKNKQLFFSVYWGQKVLKSHALSNDLHEVDSLLIDLDWISDQTILQLKSLSEISDDEMVELCKLFCGLNPNAYSEHRDYVEDAIFNARDLIYKFDRSTSVCPYDIISVSDYLRSRGYLLPFNGLSIKQIKEYGWAKL